MVAYDLYEVKVVINGSILYKPAMLRATGYLGLCPDIQVVSCVWQDVETSFSLPL